MNAALTEESYYLCRTVIGKSPSATAHRPFSLWENFKELGTLCSWDKNQILLRVQLCSVRNIAILNFKKVLKQPVCRVVVPSQMGIWKKIVYKIR